MEERAMGRRKKNNQRGEAIAKMIMEQYKPGSREEAQEAIKDIFGPIFEAMLQGEMEEHLGYVSNDHGSKETDNRRNGYIDKNEITAIPFLVPYASERLVSSIALAISCLSSKKP